MVATDSAAYWKSSSEVFCQCVNLPSCNVLLVKEIQIITCQWCSADYVDEILISRSHFLSAQDVFVPCLILISDVSEDHIENYFLVFQDKKVLLNGFESLIAAS